MSLQVEKKEKNMIRKTREKSRFPVSVRARCPAE